jgi:hypothetical protein
MGKKIHLLFIEPTDKHKQKCRWHILLQDKTAGLRLTTAVYGNVKSSSWLLTQDIMHNIRLWHSLFLHAYM